MPDDPEAEILAGRYRPVAVVGRGGQATVVKALDIRHDRLVALKVRPVPVDDAAAAAAQLAEARALLSLPGHEGLAHARDDFFDGDRHMLVLDWVDGVDLAQILGSRGSPGLPASSVVRWLAQAAEAITVLHAHDIVHGDIKPANLVLDGRGRVVVVDLGSSSVPGHVGRGGTPGFRAPELSDGAVPTRANDVYGLAATAFALLTGAAPAGVLPSWQDIAPAQAAVLEAALRAGLTVDPSHRPATPGEFVERLRAGWGDRVPTGVTTVVLTDVVGSTELWSRIPARMPSVLAGLQLAVDAAVEAHGGARLGATIEGDSTVSAFPSALDAVTAAVALQRSLAASPPESVELPPLRIGVATGEVVAVGGDIVGATVSRAARIRDLAGAGEILLSGSTAAVVAPALPADVELVSLGQHALRGIEDRDEVHAVVAAGVAAPPDPSRCPYPGLAAFTVDDSPFFVGREALVAECLSRFPLTGFVGLIGGSGTGKSSLARAGLVPHLDGATVLTPGEHPLATLASALGEVPSGGVLIVDQLEEVVTLCRDRAEQEAFLDAVRCHEGGAVVALRADLYGELAGFGEFSDVLAANHVLVGPLSREELERTVAEPAARCGLSVEPGLVEVVVGELSNEPGTLPLLGHALRETWMRRDGRRLTVEGYRAAGGVDGAIARTAGLLFDELHPADRQAARELLLRMVELRDDGDDVRRWVALDEIRTVGTGRGLGVLERLASARLVTVEADRATLAHEALLSAWPTLRDWVRDERDGLVIRQQVRRASAIWVDGGRGDADLYRGRRLDATVEWRDTTHPGLTAAEAEFLDASVAEAVRERDALTEQACHQARQNRRLRVALGIGAVLLVVAAATSVVAVGQRDRAERSVAEARAAETVAEARRISTLALTVENLDQALLLAVEAVHLHDSNDTRSNLFAVLNRAPQAFAVVGPPAGDPLVGMATVDGGRNLAVARLSGVELLDADTLRPTGRSLETVVEWGDAASTPDGARFAVLDMSFSPRPRVLFLDPTTGERTDVHLEVPEPFAWTNPTVAISDDGRWVAVSNHRLPEEDLPPRRWIWDLAAPLARPMEIDGGGDAPTVAFSADGVLVVSGDDPAAGVTALDPASGDVVASIADARTPVAVGHGGLVGVRQGDTLALFDLASAQRRHVLAGTSAPVAVAFSPDGSLVAVARQNGSIETWDTDTGQRVDVLAGTNAPAELLEFAGDGSTLLSGSLGGSIMAWDLRGDRRVVRQISRPDPSIDGQGNVPSPDPTTDVQHSVPSPDGESVVHSREVAGPDEWLVQDVATGHLRDVVPTGFPVTTWHGWTPDGRNVVTVGEVPPVGVGDGTVRLWDPVTGELVAERALPFESPSGSIGWRPGGDTILVGLHLGGVVELDADTLDEVGEPIEYDGHVSNVDLSPDGRLVAVAFLDFDPARRTSVILVDHATSEVLDTFDDVDATYGLEFSPDGSLLAAGGGDGLVTLIDPAARRLVGAPFEHKFVNSVAWSPDGDRLLSTSLDGTIDLWDVDRHSRIVQVTPAGPGVPTVAWFRDGGATVAVVDDRGGMWSFPSDPAEPPRRACEIAGRNLTSAEWSELLPNHPYRQTCPDEPPASG